MHKVAILGVTGYSGEELLRILLRHPGAEVSYVSANNDRGLALQAIYPDLEGQVDLVCGPLDKKEALAKANVFFLALPHTVSQHIAPSLIAADKTVIDISADYRLKDDAVYGLPEWKRDAIRGAKLVANPGCYPTAAILALLPLLRKGVVWKGSCIIDAKSGYSGAGRKSAEAMLEKGLMNNFKAYKVLAHGHEAEIQQAMTAHAQAGVFDFVPHLLPLKRGILESIYLSLDNDLEYDALRKLYEAHYAKEPFVQVLEEGQYPELKDVVGTNQCHLGLAWRPRSKTFVVISAIDNLLKGASGQAVQNFNLMCGLDEGLGLFK